MDQNTYLQPRVRVMIGDVPTLTGSHVRAVLMFAEDTHVVANWWAAAFGVEQVEVVQDPEGDFVSFETHGVELGIHPADEQKIPSVAARSSTGLSPVSPRR